MSMSSNVIGFKPPDEKWRQMKLVYDACRTAGVDVPETVNEFFNHEKPDDMGVVVEIPFHEYRDDMQEGFEVHLLELPADIRVIRFFNSY